MPETNQRLDRRMFMRVLGGLVCGPWLPCTACDVSAPPAKLTGTNNDGGAGRTATAEPTLTTSGTPQVRECPEFLTPASEHFRQFGARSYIEGWQMPQLGDEFALRIEGLVNNELSVTLAELEAIPERMRVLKTMVCVFGLTSTAIWTGIPLRVLLERAGVKRERAVRARFFGQDGFENNLPLAAIFEAQAPFEPLIAFHLYDQRLPPEHGFPFRLLLADRYGYKNIKWLQRIELSEHDEPTGHYQSRGYSDAGFIEPHVMTEGLRVTETLPVGPLELCGFAVSGYAGIAAVEVRIDAGEPMQAQLLSASQLAQQEPQLADTLQLRQSEGNASIPAVWTVWRLVVQIQPGEQRVAIRAHDVSGREADATTLRILGSG